MKRPRMNPFGARMARRLAALLMAWACLGAALAAGGTEGAAAAGPASLPYFSLEPVRRWDVDVTYRFQRRQHEQTSLPALSERREREQAHELALSVRARLGARSVGIVRIPLSYWQTEGSGWRAGPAGWERWDRRGSLLALRPVAVGWRREAHWRAPDDLEWGADVVLGTGSGWLLVPRARWVWLRDPVVVGVEVGAPWRFSAAGPARAEDARLQVTVDHAVNARLVLMSGVSVEGDRPGLLWGWSMQLRPDRYWSVQVEFPVQRDGFSLQAGWRLRI